MFRLFGLLDAENVQLIICGAIRKQGESVQPVAVNLRGGWKEIDSGTWKPGDKSTLKVAVAVSYFKLAIDGDEMVEIDALNLVRRIGGKDQMADIRSAIGL